MHEFCQPVAAQIAMLCVVGMLVLSRCMHPEVKGLRPPGRPRSSFNDVALRDCQNCRIGRPYRDAQDRLLWKDKTCPACT